MLYKNDFLRYNKKNIEKMGETSQEERIENQ